MTAFRIFVALALLLVAGPAWAAFTVTTATSTEATNTTAHDVTLPGSIASGDTVVACLGVDADTTATWPSPWVEILESTAGGSGLITCGRLFASGGETTVQVTTVASEQSAHVAYRIQGAHASTSPEAATTSASSSTTPDPPSFDPAGWGTETSLWLAPCITASSNVYSADPTNYTNGIEAASGRKIRSTQRELSAASEDPGTYTKDSIGAWRCTTIAVRPAAAGAAGGSRGTLMGVGR